MYDLYSKFDIEQHKQHYVHYLEVVMFPDGTVEYAVPSHQEKLIAICCDQLHVSRSELSEMCPEDYYFDFVTWLCNMSGCVSIWSGAITKPDNQPLTNAQWEMLHKLQDEGLYEGEL